MTIQNHIKLVKFTSRIQSYLLDIDWIMPKSILSSEISAGNIPGKIKTITNKILTIYKLLIDNISLYFPQSKLTFISPTLIPMIHPQISSEQSQQQTRQHNRKTTDRKRQYLTDAG